MAFDLGGLLLPFQIAFCLLSFTTIFAAFFLPYIDPAPPHPENANQAEADAIKEKRSRSFLHPLKIFIPRYITLPNGKRKLDWNLTFLGLGAFFSVLATGYVGMGLQLVATNVFGFKPGPSGLMLVCAAIGRLDCRKGIVDSLVTQSRNESILPLNPLSTHHIDRPSIPIDSPATTRPPTPTLDPAFVPSSGRDRSHHPATICS